MIGVMMYPVIKPGEEELMKPVNRRSVRSEAIRVDDRVMTVKVGHGDDIMMTVIVGRGDIAVNGMRRTQWMVARRSLPATTMV